MSDTVIVHFTSVGGIIRYRIIDKCGERFRAPELRHDEFQGCVSRSDEGNPLCYGVFIINGNTISLHLLQSFAHCKTPLLPTRPRIPHPTKTTHITPQTSPQTTESNKHPISPSQKMSKLSPAIIAIIVIFSIVAAFLLATLLSYCCFCYNVASMFRSPSRDDGRRKHKVAPRITSSGYELRTLPRSAQDEESHGRKKDVVSLSGVTVC